jgi:hypothetical protein
VRATGVRCGVGTNDEEAGVATAEPTTRSPVFRVVRAVTWLVYAFAISATVFLATAFLLRLFDANSGAPFVQWVYRATRIFMEPFRGIFPTVEGQSGSVFDASLLFGVFMYWLLAVAIHALLDWIDRKASAPRYDSDAGQGYRAPPVDAGSTPPYVPAQPTRYAPVPDRGSEIVEDPVGAPRRGGSPGP